MKTSKNGWYGFPHPLGGKNVLESFTNETDAREFWQDQIDNAD